MRVKMKTLALAGASLAASVSSAYEIRMPEKKDGTQMLAVEELVRHLDRKATEVPYDFVFAKPDGEPEPAEFESCYLVKDGTVWFWGDDSGPSEDWDWGDNRGKVSRKRNGTLFAVELFAREQLGMRFVWAGRDGVVCWNVNRLELKDGARGSYTSTLSLARIRSYESYFNPKWKDVSRIMPEELFGTPSPTTHAERLLWHKRNLLQDRDFFTYGHAFRDWYERFSKTHPEYMNLHVDPKTGKEERGWTWAKNPAFVKLCVSNEGVVDQIVADWVAAGKPKFLNVCENDANSCWCECPNCRALDAPKEGEGDLEVLTDRYVSFWNRIAKKALAIRPDTKLVTYLYSSYRTSPRRERLEYGDAMICGFVCDETENAMRLINGWKAAGMEHFFFRPNYLHTITCIHRGLERYFFDQFHEMLDAGMIGVDYDANDNRPTTSLEFYVLARAFSDSKAKFDDIMADYCSAYGKAASDVRAYYEAVQRDGAAARDAAEKRGEALAGMDFDTRKNKLPHFTDGGRNETELRAKLAMLETSVTRHAAAKDLSKLQLARLKNLALQAKHGLLTFRFLNEVETLPVDQLKARADELNAFRVANRKELPDLYGAIYRLWWSEIRYWNCYLQRLGKDKVE